ncbi:MAG: type II toxin-antitoxin system RelE/ParE family toxin [Pseudomonadota bacterium]|nr:type II toxin-antitoxin system RelE/ParE family toxin [Pseudomonadota bacterium]
MKPVVPRDRADQDVDEAIAYYAKGAPHVVDQLIDALEAAHNTISDAPKTGSPRYGTSLDIPGYGSSWWSDSPTQNFILNIRATLT